MNARADIQAKSIISVALRSRGLMPMDGLCVCEACGATGLDRDEMAGERDFFAKHLAAFAARYAGPICTGCAHDALICDSCEACVDELHECEADSMNVCESCVDRADTGDGYANRVAAI